MGNTSFLKKILNWILVILVFFLIGYIGYRVYDAAVENLTKRIRQEVSNEIIDTINPLKWPGKIFGIGRKKESDKK